MSTETAKQLEDAEAKLEAVIEQLVRAQRSLDERIEFRNALDAVIVNQRRAIEAQGEEILTLLGKKSDIEANKGKEACVIDGNPCGHAPNVECVYCGQVCEHVRGAR